MRPPGITEDMKMKSLPNPFLDVTPEPSTFVLDEEAFLADIEPLPTFLSKKPIQADELIPMLEILART